MSVQEASCALGEPRVFRESEQTGPESAVNANAHGTCAFELPQRTGMTGERVGKRAGKKSSARERQTQSAGRHRIDACGGVADQDETGRRRLARAPDERGPAHELTRLNRTVEPAAEQRLVLNPAAERTPEITAHNVLIRKCGDEHLSARKWRHVEIVTGPHEDLNVGPRSVRTRPAEVSANADTPRRHRSLQAERAPQRR